MEGKLFELDRSDGVCGWHRHVDENAYNVCDGPPDDVAKNLIFRAMMIDMIGFCISSLAYHVLFV
jgi:hypothetical protein